MQKTLNELRDEIHTAHAKWWQDIHTGAPVKRDVEELLALVISELCEGLEGLRKNLMDDKLPHRRMIEVELADAKIRLFDFAGGFSIDLAPYEAFRRKVEFSFLNGRTPSAGIFGLVSTIMDCDRLKAIDVVFALYAIDYYAQTFNYDVEGAMRDKLAYNATRADHTHESRRQAGGKIF